MESNRVFFVFESEFRSFERQWGNDTEVFVWRKWDTFMTKCEIFVYKVLWIFCLLQKCAEKYCEKKRAFKQCDLVLPPSVCWTWMTWYFFAEGHHRNDFAPYIMLPLFREVVVTIEYMFWRYMRNHMESPNFWLLLVTYCPTTIIPCLFRATSLFERVVVAPNMQNMLYTIFVAMINYIISKWRFWCILAFRIKYSFAVLQIWELALYRDLSTSLQVPLKETPKKGRIDNVFWFWRVFLFLATFFLSQPEGYLRMICQKQGKIKISLVFSRWYPRKQVFNRWWLDEKLSGWERGASFARSDRQKNDDLSSLKLTFSHLKLNGWNTNFLFRMDTHFQRQFLWLLVFFGDIFSSFRPVSCHIFSHGNQIFYLR